MSNISQPMSLYLRSFASRKDPNGVYPSANVRQRFWTDFRNGSEDPKWKEKVKKGEDATGELTAERQTFAWRPSPRVQTIATYPGNWVEERFVWGAVCEAYQYAFDVNDFVSNLGQVDNLALVRLHNDIQGKINQYSGGTFAGELRETIKMLRSPAQGIKIAAKNYLDNCRKIPKGVPPGKASKRYNGYVNALSSLWLEFVFGVKPLVNDIRDIAALFGQNDDVRRSSARGHANSEWFTTNANNNSIAFSGYPLFTGTRERRTTKGVRVIYRAGLNHKLSAPFGSFERLQEMAGFTWNQFVPTIYNLLPYSWLVDYFTTLGDCISCLATDRSVVSWVNRTVIYSLNTYETFTWDKVKSRTLFPYPDDAFTSCKMIGGTDLGWTMSHFERVERRKSTFRYPTVEFRVPPLDSAKWLNVAALVLQGASVSKTLANSLR